MEDTAGIGSVELLPTAERYLCCLDIRWEVSVVWDWPAHFQTDIAEIVPAEVCDWYASAPQEADIHPPGLQGFSSLGSIALQILT